MIAFLKGIVAEITPDNVVIEVNGVGYNVCISHTTADMLPGFGMEVKLYTYTLVREDAFLLYGFLDKNELELFKKCITVNGIGPKGALAILSVMDADSLRFAIIAGDAKAISKAPGIGAKTAERLILDLKDKISVEDTLKGRLDSSVGMTKDNNIASQAKKEAIEALVALGYGQSDALKAVNQVEIDETEDSEWILKVALKNLF